MQGMSSNSVIAMQLALTEKRCASLQNPKNVKIEDVRSFMLLV